MLKTIFSRVSGRGKTVVLVVVALTVLTCGTAAAITYTTSTKPALKLNKASFVGTALTKLASNAIGPALTLETDSTDPNATPLSLDTNDNSQAPMTVDSSTKVANLNADQLDTKDSTEFLPATIYRKSENATDTCVPGQFQCVVPSKTVNCNAGDQAIGGGVSGVDDAGTIILDNHPTGTTSTNVTGWRVSWRDDASKDTLTVFVVCADF